MRIVCALGFAVAIFAASSRAQQPVSPRFWTGTLQIRQLNFGYGRGHGGRENKEYTYRNVRTWKYNYKFFLNPDGVAREELTFINRNRSVEGPLDFKLLDFHQGIGLAFDKAERQAERGPLIPPASPKPLGTARILGFECDGKEYEWTTFQDAKVQLSSWSARNPGPRIPLLQIKYFFDKTGALLALTVEVVSELEVSPELPPSLFSPPAGMKIVQVPTMQ